MQIVFDFVNPFTGEIFGTATIEWRFGTHPNEVIKVGGISLAKTFYIAIYK